MRVVWGKNLSQHRYALLFTGVDRIASGSALAAAVSAGGGCAYNALSLSGGLALWVDGLFTCAVKDVIEPMKRAGLLLISCAVLGTAFFVLTDPHAAPDAINQLGWGSNLVDAVQYAVPGTIIGLAGAGIIACIGFWLVVRRSV